MAVEERFGIAIADSDTAELSTVGAFYEYILRRLERTYPVDACMTSATFYRLRRGLMVVCALPRSAIRPETDLRKLFPFTYRRRAWSKLAETAELRLPGLKRPEWIMWAIALSGVAFTAFMRFHMLVELPQSVLFGGMWVIIALFATQPLQACIPIQCSTIRQLVYAVLPKQGSGNGIAQWTAESVWSTLQDIVVEQLGVERELVTPEANWKQDLGLD